LLIEAYQVASHKCFLTIGCAGEFALKGKDKCFQMRFCIKIFRKFVGDGNALLVANSIPKTKKPL
jgi:hypothetical protein